jgi:NTP pyrophosphatase (non-canonical NTP hydrolase)
MTQDEALELIKTEQARYPELWGRDNGVWNSPAYTKMTVLTEEIGEVAHAILERDQENLKEELVQCAAVILEWLMSDFRSNDVVES